ncbi:MAG: hypothetical protein EXX96DRAFT_646335 [Benjaminiella poitrasii]|nr:MAG: hypothetical protein EXX96DRAFT_646335 [Benjaminiella poitrasii]
MNVVKLRFNEFDITRRHPSNGSYLYQIPYCDSLHGYMANQFSTSIIKNIRLHLTKNIPKIYTASLKHSSDSSPSTSKAALDYGISTDGHMGSLLFKTVSVELFPYTPDERQFVKTNINIANWKKGQYKLNKQPSGFLPSDRIIGLDPCIRNLATAVYKGHEQFVDKPSSKASSISLSNIEYKICSGFAWCIQEELKKRRHVGIQPYYGIFPTAKVATSRYKHRELKRYLYSNRQAALNHITDTLLKKRPKDTPFKLCHRSSRNERERIKKTFFEERRMSSRNIQNRRIVVAYGDAGFSHSTKGHASAPTKKLQRSLAKKAVVITVDEFRTSNIYSHCHSGLDVIHVPERVFDCQHNQCPYKSATSYPYTVYPLKLCKQCLARSRRGNLVWDRDVNAVINIRSVLINYILSVCNINSRPIPLSRGALTGTTMVLR